MTQLSASEELVELLIASDADIGELGASSGWSIHLGRMEDSPDTCISLIDGVPSDSPSPNYTYDYPSVQIRVRGNQGGYSEAHAKILEIKNLIHGGINEVIGDSKYIQILCAIDIEFLGFDEKDRPIWSSTFDCHRTENV